MLFALGVPRDDMFVTWVVALQYDCKNMAEQVELRSL